MASGGLTAWMAGTSPAMTTLLQLSGRVVSNTSAARPTDVPRARHFDAAALRAIADRSDQRLVLRVAEPGSGGDLRHVEYRQLRARRVLYGRRLHRLFPAASGRRELLGRPRPRPVDRRRDRRDHGTDVAEAHRGARPSLWPAAHLRARAGHPGAVPELFRRLWPALSDPARVAGRAQSRLHVLAQLPRLGHRVFGDRLLRDLVPDREDPARRLSARRHGEPDARARLRHQRAADD